MTKVTNRQHLPALDNSKPVSNPDLFSIADKNYASTILRYSNLAILYSQLDTKDKHIVGAINEINKKVQPAKRVGETDVVGGVIIGDGLSVTEEGVLSANAQGLTPATADKLGGIMVGENLSITEEGVLSADAQELEPATTNKLGGIKVGDYLDITSDGTLSVDSSAVGKTYYSGQLTTIDTQNKINVNMTKSTPANIEQESRDNPNVLFFTEGHPGGCGSGLYTSTVILTSLGWDSNNEQTVSVSDITADSGILVSPAPAYIEYYANYGVYAIGQATNSITFKCGEIPESDIQVNIAFWEGVN